MRLMEAPYDIPASDWQVEAVETLEPQLSETEKHRWIWLFERLKRAELGLSISQKAKIFCEASAPEEVEDFIQAQQHEETIIPLAA